MICIGGKHITGVRDKTRTSKDIHFIQAPARRVSAHEIRPPQRSDLGFSREEGTRYREGDLRLELCCDLGKSRPNR